MSHCPVPTELHRTFVLRQPRPAGPRYKLRSRQPTPGIISTGNTSQPNQAAAAAAAHHHQLRRLARPVGTGAYVARNRSSRPARSEMGSCFSSSSSGSAGDDAAGYGDERRVRRVWPSDDDGGEWDVDSRAAIYIAKFHRHQSGVVCSDCAADQQQQTPAAAATAAQ